MGAKKSNKKKGQPMTPSDVAIYIFRIFVSAYVCIFFVAMPLFYNNAYYDIGDFKYKMFMHITVIFLIFALIMTLVYLGLQIAAKKINLESTKALIKSLSVTDWFVIAFGIVSTISYLLSDSRTDEFHLFNEEMVNLPWDGYKGWNMGLRSQLIFVLLYFFISRLFMKSWFKDFLYMMLGSAFIAFFFGVLHRFYIDPLGLYEGLDEYYKYKFLSTLGQSSWYSSFMVVLLPIGMSFFLYQKEKKSVQNILLGAYVAVGAATFVTQNSDSAYLPFVAAVTIMFAASFKSNELFIRFWEMMIIMLAAIKIVGIFQIIFPEHVPALDSLSFFVTKSWVTWALLGIVVAFYVYIRAQAQDLHFDITKYTKIRNILVALVIACLPLGILVTIFNTTGAIDIAALKNIEYLTFSDGWGNNRGYTWRNTIELMGEDMWKSMCLFGPGPDCYATVAYALDPRATEMYNFWNGELVVCCHNEWLNMLFNEGILGFVTYFGIFVSAFIAFLKKYDNPIMTAGLASILGYFLHNLFCYQQILCTPMIFCVIALCEYARRYHLKEETEFSQK